jgi:hypothetical protein
MNSILESLEPRQLMSVRLKPHHHPLSNRVAFVPSPFMVPGDPAVEG